VVTTNQPYLRPTRDLVCAGRMCLDEAFAQPEVIAPRRRRGPWYRSRAVVPPAMLVSRLDQAGHGETTRCALAWRHENRWQFPGYDDLRDRLEDSLNRSLKSEQRRVPGCGHTVVKLPARMAENRLIGGEWRARRGRRRGCWLVRPASEDGVQAWSDVCCTSAERTDELFASVRLRACGCPTGG
jgi:hypothetical protein